MIRRISVIGAGAMGAYYASKLFDMDPRSVFLTARGDRFGRLRDKGIIVNGRKYQIKVNDPTVETAPFDMILCAVKSYHLDEAIEDMRNLVGQDTIIISVMNGIDSERQIGSVFGMEKILYSVAVGIDAVREGNAVRYTREGKLLFGEADNSNLTEKVKRVKNLLVRARIPHEIPVDMIRALWWKFMVNIGINQVSAVLGASYGIFQRSSDARQLTAMAMEEVIEIAQKEGVNLSREDIAQWNRILMELAPEGKTSMLQDIEAKRKTEVDMFAARVIELGKKYGISTKVNQVLLGCIRVLEGHF
jgi:2-dehydropantoate 2-reductase